MASPLISVTQLADLLRDGVEVCLLDVRWRLDQPEGRPEYLDGHLPGAVYVDLERELAEHGHPEQGRHPLPSDDTLRAAVRRWGLRRGARVVIYDDVHSVAAARAWWVLTHAGIADIDVRVLDGGLRAWAAAGFGLETGDVQPPVGDAEVEGFGEQLGMVETARWPQHGVLLDVRSAERYRGDPDTHDPVAGHIPGARNLPTTYHLTGGRFRTPAEIRRNFASLGVDETVPVAAYCGSGIAAAHTVLAGAVAGLDVALYPGSWSQWSRTRGREVALGMTPAQRIRRV